ncbi:MAG: restriction endonuclease [Candidatus Zixiibacteriota bacterium]
MAVWLVRAGQRGERQNFALEHNVAVVGWDEIEDLKKFKDRESLESACLRVYPDAKPLAAKVWGRQLWSFANRIQVGDLVALPLKDQDAIAFGTVTGTYEYISENPTEAKHTLPVRWIGEPIPRARFDQDILYSLGAYLTVCQIKRNDAESRIRLIVEGKASPITQPVPDGEEPDEIDLPPNLEDYARTQIQSYIGRKFAGHRLADLIAAILEVQGYVTEISPPGPDGGVDIIAGRGPMGFNSPRLCVQVRSGDGQQDVKVVRELKGVMKEFGADQGLFVSWGGFKRSVIADERRQFFEIRLWDSGDVVSGVLAHYDRLPENIKAELPLKRVWVLVPEE